MAEFLNFLSENGIVSFVAGTILAVALLAYLFWFAPAIQSVHDGLKAAALALRQVDQDWPVLKERVRPVLKKYPHLESTWNETESRVVSLPLTNKTFYVMFGSPRDLWNPAALLSRRFNNPLAESVPNILVGIGLFFTFVFLSLALIDATAALKPGVSSAKESEAAIQSLLNVAGGKFLTSLAGLLASILWTFSSKLTAKKLTRACDEFLDSLAKVVRQSGGEYVMLRELEISNERVELSRELLLETREQTGTFKRFETDLAVSLAGAINESFAPQMELMTSKLVTAIDSLSEKLGSMNQDALEKMTKDFSAMLQQNTETEMSQLRTTLQDLSSRLEGAGTVFGDGAKDAASAINEAGAQLVQRVQEISENLATGAINLDGAASSIKLAMNDLEVTVVEASNLGKKGVLVFNAALANASETVDKLSNASSGLAHASQAIESVGGKISDVVDTVEELSREQRAVVMAVKEVAPTALAAVERVSGVLNQAAQQTLGVMEQTKQSMETTANTLGRTVASITEGVTVYTDQVAQLHIKMDEQFAKAVGSFDKGVTELSESVEELAEVMQTRTKG